MNTRIMRAVVLAAGLAFGWMLTTSGRAGEAKNWNEVPEAVRATILANGGKVGSVDLESHKIRGKAVYEAVGKDKAGKDVDLVVTEDGKLADMKYDGAADKAQEDAAQVKKAGNALAKLKFTHPRDITNPWLPLASLKQDILEGQEGSKHLRIERTIKPELHKIFKVGKQNVEVLVMEDREFEDGKLSEITLDYIAQADDGTVCYLGEDVDEYKNGKVSGHGGAWLLGVQTKIPGVLMPGNPKVGDKFRSEDVPKITTEDDEVLSLTETINVPAGTYENCLKMKEVLSDGGVDYKYYAKGVGCIRELPEGGDVVLKSHTAK